MTSRNPNGQLQQGKEQELDYELIGHPLAADTDSPPPMLKPSTVLKEETVWDSLRASSLPTNNQRRTSVGHLHLRGDPEPLSSSRRRKSYQIGGEAMPFLFRAHSPPSHQAYPSPFLRHSSAMAAPYDLTLSEHHHPPQAHLHFAHNRPFYHFQHSHSLPPTPSPLPLVWPESSHASGFPTLSPPPSQFVQDGGTFSVSSGPVHHKTPPSNPFNTSEAERSSCSSATFASIPTSGYTPSLSLTHYNFDLRPMSFLNDSLDKNTTESQDPILSHQSTPIQSMFPMLRAPQHHAIDAFPTRPLSANAVIHPRPTTPQIDPSLIPDHMSTDLRFGLSRSIYDGSRRASMVEESLLSSIVHREFANPSPGSHDSLVIPLPSMSPHSQKPSIAGSPVEDPNASLDSLTSETTAPSQLSASYLPLPQSTSQRASSLPPPVIPDSMRYLLLTSPSDSNNPSPLASTFIHGDANSLFDEAFSALAGPLHSSLGNPLGDLSVNFEPETHEKGDDRCTGSAEVERSPSLAKIETSFARLDSPCPKTTLPPFSALAYPASASMTEGHHEAQGPENGYQMHPVTKETLGNHLRRTFPDPAHVQTRKLDESGDSPIESVYSVERRHSVEAALSPTATRTGAPFQCTDEGCQKTFGRRSDLARHTRIHTGERPYPCEYAGCGKRFIQRSALTVHMRTHSGEKPHLCVFPGCAKAFADSSSLARHRRTHTKNKLYLCKVGDCDKNFSRRAALVKHLKSHENEIGSGIGNPHYVEQHSSEIDISETGLSTTYNPPLDFMPRSRTRENHHLQSIASRSPRLPSSYVNSPLSTSMTPNDNHFPSRRHPSINLARRDAAARGPAHLGPPPRSMSQHRPQFTFPSINPQQLYPTGAHQAYYHSLPTNAITPCSPHFNRSSHSSPTSNSSTLPTLSPSATASSALTALLSSNHHSFKPISSLNLSSVASRDFRGGSSQINVNSGSSNGSSVLVDHSVNLLDEKGDSHQRSGINGHSSMMCRTHFPQQHQQARSSMEVGQSRPAWEIYEDENVRPVKLEAHGDLSASSPFGP